MHNINNRTRSPLHKLGVGAVVPLVLLVGCGSDDESSSTTEAPTTTESTTTVAPGTDAEASLSEEFCGAQADLAAAQDGAQRNTAIGEMQDALGQDPPPGVTEALDTLLIGDLDPEDYSRAEQTLADACT